MENEPDVALSALEIKGLRQILPIAIEAMRKIAVPVGPQHSYWEVIQDAEALLARIAEPQA